MRAMASYTITKIKDGNDVDVIVTEYIKTNSGTAAPSQDDVGWSEDMPEFEAGMFLWTRNKIYINDPTEEFPIVIYTDPVLDTTWAAVNEVDRKYTEIKQDVDEVKIIAEGLEDDYAELKITSEGISTRVEGLEEVVVGNENLITNTNPAVGWKKGWSNPNADWAEYSYGRFNEDITDPFPQMIMMNPGTYYTGTLGGKEYQYKDSIWMESPWIPEKEGVYMKPDTQYTLSFDIWRNADSVLSPISFEFDLAENPYTPAWFLSASNYDALVPADESWHRAYATIIIPSNYVGKSTLRGVRLRFTNSGVEEVGKTSIIKIANFQLSETGLSFQDNFVNFATAINQTNRKIKLQASAIDDSKSRISLLEVNQGGILAKVEDNTDNLSLVEQKVDRIKLSVTTEGDTVSLEINGSKQTIDLTGRVTFSDLKNNSNTEINGSYIKTGTIAAERLDLSGVATIAGLKNGTTVIDGGCISTGKISAERLDLSSRESRNGYIFETVLMDGMLLSVRHSGNLLNSSNPACALDPVEGLSLGTYGTAYAEIYTSGNVLKIKGVGGIHLNDKAFPGGFSLSEFSNNAIAMATAYTTTVDITGGKDIDMSSITEKDSVGVFSRDRYSNSYGYGIKCSKEGYYLVSAHLSIKSSGTVTPTTAIRKVVGGTSTFIAKATDYVYCSGSGTFPHSHQIPARVVYLEANSYLSLYVHDSACSTTADGCHLTAVYLGI